MTTERRVARALLGAVLAGAALLGYALWWRRAPSACPYGLRFFLELPHPFITRKRLREVIAPRPGERAEAAGLCFERRVGGRLGYFARFRAPARSDAREAGEQG